MGDVLLLLDDDVVPAPGLVSGHAAHHAARDGLVVVGAMPVDLGPSEPRPRYPRALYGADYARRVAGWTPIPRRCSSASGRATSRCAAPTRCASASTTRPTADTATRTGTSGCAAARPGWRASSRRSCARPIATSRAPEAFFADARAQGAEQAQLARLHPNAAVPTSARDLLAGVPAPLAPVLLARHAAPRGDRPAHCVAQASSASRAPHGPTARRCAWPRSAAASSSSTGGRTPAWDNEPNGSTDRQPVTPAEAALIAPSVRRLTPGVFQEVVLHLVDARSTRRTA